MRWWNSRERFRPSLKVKGLKLRYFFKQALKDVLPPETIAKTKHGFGMPFGLWLRTHKPLAEVVHGSLDAFQRRGIIKPAYIQDVAPSAPHQPRDLLRHHDLGRHDARVLAREA